MKLFHIKSTRVKKNIFLFYFVFKKKNWARYFQKNEKISEVTIFKINIFKQQKPPSSSFEERSK
jgi:hypothetical protein